MEQTSLIHDVCKAVEDELDVRANNWLEYYNSLRRLALKVERLGTQIGTDMALNDALLDSIEWRRDTKQALKRSQVFYYAHLRANEFCRGIEVHIKNCSALFPEFELKDCVSSLAGELPILLSRLWWISNLVTPVSQYVFS